MCCGACNQYNPSNNHYKPEKIYFCIHVYLTSSPQTRKQSYNVRFPGLCVNTCLNTLSCVFLLCSHVNSMMCVKGSRVSRSKPQSVLYSEVYFHRS